MYKTLKFMNASGFSSGYLVPIQRIMKLRLTNKRAGYRDENHFLKGTSNFLLWVHTSMRLEQARNYRYPGLIKPLRYGEGPSGRAKSKGDGG